MKISDNFLLQKDFLLKWSKKEFDWCQTLPYFTYDATAQCDQQSVGGY